MLYLRTTIFQYILVSRWLMITITSKISCICSSLYQKATYLLSAFATTAANYYTQISLKLIFLYLFNLSLKDKLKEEPGEISAGLNNQWSDDQKMISQSVGHLWSLRGVCDHGGKEQHCFGRELEMMECCVRFPVSPGIHILAPDNCLIVTKDNSEETVTGAFHNRSLLLDNCRHNN